MPLIQFPGADLLPPLRTYRRAAESALLGLAYADEPTADPSDPTALSEALRLPDPGGWHGLLERLLSGPEAAELDRLGVDVRALAVHEVERVQRARVGPAGGPLHGEALERVLGRVGDAGGRSQRLALDGRLPEGLRASLWRLSITLGPGLQRLAAADFGAARFETPAAVPAAGAIGWAVHVTAEPLSDRSWLVSARRVWLGEGEPPDGPVLTVRLAGQAHALTAAEAAWYQDDLPADPALEVSV